MLNQVFSLHENYITFLLHKSRLIFSFSYNAIRRSVTLTIVIWRALSLVIFYTAKVGLLHICTQKGHLSWAVPQLICKVSPHNLLNGLLHSHKLVYHISIPSLMAWKAEWELFNVCAMPIWCISLYILGEWFCMPVSLLQAFCLAFKFTPR